MPDVTAEINHPRNCLVMWRGEAARMLEHAGTATAAGMEAEAAVFTVRARCLEQCADELENRLAWSGLS